MARVRWLRRFVSSMAAQPTRKRQLGMSMLRSLPKYQFCAGQEGRLYSNSTWGRVLVAAEVRN